MESTEDRFGATAVRLVGALWCAAVLLACGSAPHGAAEPGLSPSNLHARPLRLPAAQPSAACPVSPEISLPPQPFGVKNVRPDYAFGRGPTYLSGQLQWYAGASGQVAVIVVDPEYSGPILIRTRRIDRSGSAALTNVDVPAAGRLPGMLPSGTVTSDGVEVEVTPPSITGLWNVWLGRLTFDKPGCYGLQVDGTSFSSVIVFAVQKGPVPPA